MIKTKSNAFLDGQSVYLRSRICVVTASGSSIKFNRSFGGKKAAQEARGRNSFVDQARKKKLWQQIAGITSSVSRQQPKLYAKKRKRPEKDEKQFFFEELSSIGQQ